jgi:UDP-2,3-diacylglucosamine hydrolase
VKSALRRLHDAGVRVYFQAGNRDFLVGAAFARDTGVELIADYAVIDLAGAPTLITHGDLLCSDDVQYLQARVKVRAADWQRQALAKPLWLRRLYGRWYRLRSRLDKRGKAREIMDANTQTVLDEMRRHRVHRLIHGHTHRPGLHALELDGKPAQRHVLAAWEAQGQVLVWEAGQSSILTV